MQALLNQSYSPSYRYSEAVFFFARDGSRLQSVERGRGDRFVNVDGKKVYVSFVAVSSGEPRAAQLGKALPAAFFSG